MSHSFRLWRAYMRKYYPKGGFEMANDNKKSVYEVIDNIISQLYILRGEVDRMQREGLMKPVQSKKPKAYKITNDGTRADRLRALYNRICKAGTQTKTEAKPAPQQTVLVDNSKYDDVVYRNGKE